MRFPRRGAGFRAAGDHSRDEAPIRGERNSFSAGHRLASPSPQAIALAAPPTALGGAHRLQHVRRACFSRANRCAVVDMRPDRRASRMPRAREAVAGVFFIAGLSLHRCGLGPRRTQHSRALFPSGKISAAAPDPDLSEMQSEHIEMDDPVVPPGASGMRLPGRQIGRGSPRRSPLRLENTLTQSDGDRFCSAGGSELHKDVRDVPLGGALRNVQRGGHLFRRMSCRDVAKDLGLAR